LSARYTGHEGATKKTEVRTVSRFSDAPSFNYLQFFIIFCCS
jgi:hypothetical protein